MTTSFWLSIRWNIPFVFILSIQSFFTRRNIYRSLLIYYFSTDSSYLLIHTFSMVVGTNDTVALCSCGFVFGMKTCAWNGNKARSFRKSTRLEPFLNSWNDNKIKQCMFDINRLTYRLQISNEWVMAFSLGLSTAISVLSWNTNILGFPGDSAIASMIKGYQM